MKDKLSKPEKITMEDYLRRITHADEELANTQAYMYSKGNSESYDQWQAYHDQEMQRVVEEKDELRKRICSYKCIKTGECLKQEAVNNICSYNERLEDKVKQLEQQIKEYEDKLSSGFLSKAYNKLEQQLKEKKISEKDKWYKAGYEDGSRQLKESREVSVDKFKEIKDRMLFFYYKTDGTYKFPNSKEGDLLKMVFNLINGDKKGE